MSTGPPPGLLNSRALAKKFVCERCLQTSISRRQVSVGACLPARAPLPVEVGACNRNHSGVNPHSPSSRDRMRTRTPLLRSLSARYSQTSDSVGACESCPSHARWLDFHMRGHTITYVSLCIEWLVEARSCSSSSYARNVGLLKSVLKYIISRADTQLVLTYHS